MQAIRLMMIEHNELREWTQAFASAQQARSSQVHDLVHFHSPHNCSGTHSFSYFKSFCCSVTCNPPATKPGEKYCKAVKKMWKKYNNMIQA
jgi:hypothetical protein